ncbi:ankyrin [Hyaloscypha bicolor E]|uniref:Ankyrin n=1 Tax=Hyaloscypha bicolor E TaxID=1095630 RepID=A0A2J6SFV2_9HELO|nr:ankyrin [Hyaloscypha bicolor E]PMD49627.1 ankyrin [Hyaloscypha bicolor E]
MDAVNHAGETPFCLAVAQKQFKTATLLLKLGADVNHVDYENTTILGTLLTRYDNVLPCLKYLLEPGHHLDPANFIVESRGHSTALHLAAGARYTKRLPNELAEIMSYLLTKFPFEEHLEAKEITSGFTPLFCAVLGNNFDAVRALLATGASLDTQANAGVSLRGAKFIWLYGLSLGLFKDETHSTEDEAFIQKWKRMSRILLQASEEPVVLPKKRQKSAKDDPLFRFDAFMQISTSAGLHSPESVGGMDIYKLPEEGLLKDEEKLKLFVPKDYLAEALVLTNDNIKRCPFIVEAIGYFLTRQKNRERYALTLLMPHEGVVNSLGGFLQSSPSVPFSQRLQICLDIVTAVQVVHESGFTHGCLNPKFPTMFSSLVSKVDQKVPTVPSYGILKNLSV